MARFEPGPSTPSEMPMPPRVMEPDTFQRLGVGLVKHLQGMDGALGQVVATIAPIAGLELGPAFDQSVAPSIDALANLNLGDNGLLEKAIAAVDAVVGSVATQQLDLPDPDAPDPDLEPPPPDAPEPPNPKDIVIDAPKPIPAPELIGPDDVNRLAVDFIVAHTGQLATTEQLVALAAAAGYIQGSTVARSFVVNFLASPAALAALGL